MDVKSYVEQIRNARFGKEVRESIASAILAIDDVAETSQYSAYNSAESAKISRNAAESAATKARNAAEMAMTTTPDGYEGVVESIKNVCSLLGGSGKNKLKNTAVYASKNGLEFIVNEDKTITVNGIASEYTLIETGSFEGSTTESYKLSGCPDGGSGSKYFLLAVDSDNKYYWDYGANAIFTPSVDGKVRVLVGVRQGCTVSNLTFKPMVTDSSIQNQEYEPYTDTVNEKTTIADKNHSRLLGGSGKNMLKITATTTTKNGVTWQINDDGTILTNGGATEYAYLKMGDFVVEAGKSYRISGCPVGGDKDKGYFILSKNTATGSGDIFEVGDGTVFVADTDAIRSFFIGFRAGTEAIPRLWHPMVTLANVTDQTFEKYTDSVDAKIAEQIAAISEGNWATLTLSEGFTQDASNPVRIRKIGKLVEINGLCHPSTDDGIIGSATKVQLAQLPVGYRPSSNVDVLQKGSSYNTWLATAQALSSGGKLLASCHGAGASFVNATSASNLYVHMMFTVD